MFGWLHSVSRFVLLGCLGLSGPAAVAATLPFTEDFSANVANWADNSGGALLTHVAAGGLEGGGYASTAMPINGLGGTSVVLFRGQDEFNSSGNAFEGNWVTEGVGSFAAYVRHSAPQPLTFFTRFSGHGNFPGATAVRFVPVLPQTWTQIEFDIDPANPAFVTYEGTSFGAIFSNIGHVQVGVSVPAALNEWTAPITFDLDKASIAPIPEPASLVVALGVLVGALALRPNR